MAVQPFESQDQGYVDLVAGTEDYLNGDVAAILVTTTQTLNRATTLTYADVSGNESDDQDYSAQVVGDKAVSLEGTRVRITHSKITFTAEGDVTGRYVVYVFGAAASLGGTDRILGWVDLTGDGNASSTNAEFSFTPHADGLWEIERTAAA